MCDPLPNQGPNQPSRGIRPCQRQHTHTISFQEKKTHIWTRTRCVMLQAFRDCVRGLATCRSKRASNLFPLRPSPRALLRLVCPPVPRMWCERSPERPCFCCTKANPHSHTAPQKGLGCFVSAEKGLPRIGTLAALQAPESPWSPFSFVSSLHPQLPFPLTNT